MNPDFLRRRTVLAATTAMFAPVALAHHGWSSFDQNRPIYLSGRAASVSWRNPHVEFDLELDADLKLPADLASRALPAQTAPVDGPALLKAAQLPTRRDRRWHVELAPLFRMNAWGVPELKTGDAVELLGFTFAGERGDAVLRAEYLWVGGKAYGLRSSPA
ncbi:DUF6152 family protein [Calidifontimicrobium sp. SYSU G02091]|uniref:DUF6152 family protein n=1 Tax=Calidifontimicrobium sp. SYSU G02091 TaxID=2926421 RepID=UPI001F52E0E2|nr:DUF6152 family protein [Calidifontimicrobium sp. SYSU G02091]MCI1190723.1 DUF6152 family protein [Calidifontimicrobium sp. SYSU G02091]